MKKLFSLFVVIALIAIFSQNSLAQYLTEDFESAFVGSPGAPSGWTQTRVVLIGDGVPEANGVDGEKDWQRNTYSGGAWTITSQGTNPVGAQSGTGVLWMQDYNFGTTSSAFGSRRLESPTINLSGSTSPYVRFYFCFMQGSNTLNSRIMASSDGGTTWNPIMQIPSNSLTGLGGWERINVLIPTAYRTANCKIGVEMTNSWGSHNIWIDNFRVEEFTPTTITSAASGTWGTAGTWVGGVVPNSDNNVVIAAGHSVTLGSNIARCQNVTINGTLGYSSSTATLLFHAFGNMTINAGGTYNSLFSSVGKRTYIGGSIDNAGTLNFSVGAGNIVWLGGAPATFTNSGTITGGFISNIWHANSGGVTYNSAVQVRNTVGLYIGAVNPNGNLTVGNSLVNSQTIERARGSFTAAPLWGTGVNRSISYLDGSVNFVPCNQQTITTGEEIRYDGTLSTRLVESTFLMSTHGNVTLNYPTQIGQTSGSGAFTLTRGILITNSTNIPKLMNAISGPTGTAPSTVTPPVTHGSYVSGPLQIQFPGSGTVTRNFALGKGISYNGSTPSSNVLKTLIVGNIGPTTWANQLITATIESAPSGTVNSPLTTVMGNIAYRLNRNGGADLPATAYVTMRGMNYTFGNSDGLIGDIGQIRVAQSTTLNGTWDERSVTSGTGTIVDNTIYIRSAATGVPGPIAPLATKGEYFCWATTAPVMLYTSSTSTQTVTSSVGTGTINSQIIGLQVIMNGSLSPISLTSFDLSTNGSSAPNTDVTNAKLWYTGTSPIFATTTQFGSTYTGPNGPFTISGSQSLSNGTNYFWLTYDIPSSATPNNIVDAEFLSVTGSGSMGIQLPTVSDPGSGRLIVGPLSGTYTVGLSMMRPLTGRNIELVAKTRKVKVMVPVDGDENNTPTEKVMMPEEKMTSSKHFDEQALNRPMKETEIEETYYELQENGKKYDGPMYAEYGKNVADKSATSYLGDAVGNYATITAAVTDLNNRGVSGAVTFLLIDNGNYAGETYPIQFNNNISGISAVNNVTLKPDVGISSTIPGNINANATIRILSNYVTIDGSNSGGTDRSLTIQNNSVTTPNVVLIGSTGTTPITNITVKNCAITNGVNTSSAVVVSDAGTIGNPGYFNTVTIQNNLIERAYIGVYSNGGTTPQNGSNLFYYNNTLTTSGANAIRFCGLYMQGVNTSIVSQNTIANFDGTSNEDDRAIWIATGSINATVERNNISALNYTGTGGYGGQGIVVSPGVTSANVTVKNNMIFNLSGDGWNYTSIPTDNPIGISLLNIAQSGLNIYNNSIFLSGNTLNQTTALSMGIYVGTASTGVDLRNNIIVNNLGLLAATGQGAAAIFVQGAATQLTTSSYNCYYSNPTGNGTKEIGRLITTGQTTMAGWRTASGKDVQSFSGLPLFVSGTDLHIQSTDLTVSGRGNFIAGNNNDYDGDPRPTSQSTSVKPVDVGCDQYTPSAFATGNVCSLDGAIYMDGGLRAIENIGSGTFTVFQVRQFTGVRTPNNSLLRNNYPFKNTNPIIDTKDNTTPIRKTKVKKDGSSGGQTDAIAVNVPWLYWEIENLTPGIEPITLRFYYNEDQLATILENDLKISYWNQTEWINGFPQTIDATNNYIEVTLPSGQSWGSTALFSLEDGGAPLPVVMSRFDMAVVNRDINLSWATETEINNKGFSIERRVKTPDNQYSVWKEVSFMNGKGNSTSRIEYSYTDKKLNSGAYQYRLKQVDYNGNYEYHSPANNSDMVIGKPGSFDISQNYPNPSNPKSKIDFSMPFDGKVSIKVYDILGKEVASLINDFKPADFYTVEFDGSNVSSGTYFYRIIAEGNNQKFTKTMKMILVK